MTISFAKAVKYEARGRVALIGPAGSGKSYTALVLARLLAGPHGKIAAVDTEHGSLSKYADVFDFDVVNLDSYSPDNFLAALHAAEAAKYDVFLTDSLSHFWMGKDGALEFVDVAKKRSSSRDDMSGWKEFRPHERAMVDAMIASPLHVVCTMRTKTAYEEQVNERTGKKQRVKIGLAPVQREGLEYEFDVVGLMDEDNTLIVDKTRCSLLAGKAITKPTMGDFAPFRDWLSGAAPTASPSPAATQATAGTQAPRQSSHSPFVGSLNGNVLKCRFKNVLEKKTAKNKPYLVGSFTEQIGSFTGVFCWHASLFDALRNANGKVCQLEVEESNGRISIENVLCIGDQEYRDGKPWTENLDAEPAAAAVQPNSHGLLISDDDFPEELR